MQRGGGRQLGKVRPHPVLPVEGQTPPETGLHCGEPCLRELKCWTKLQLDTSCDRRLNHPFMSVPKNKLLSLEKSLGPARLRYLPGSIEAAFGGNPVMRSPHQGSSHGSRFGNRWRGLAY